MNSKSVTREILAKFVLFKKKLKLSENITDKKQLLRSESVELPFAVKEIWGMEKMQHCM